METVLFAALPIYIGLGAKQMFDLYIKYLFIAARVNHISLKNRG